MTVGRSDAWFGASRSVRASTGWRTEDCPCPRCSLTDLPTLGRGDHTNTGLLSNIIGLARSRGVCMLEKRDGPHTAQARRYNIHSPCSGSPGTGKATVYGYPSVSSSHIYSLFMTEFVCPSLSKTACRRGGVKAPAGETKKTRRSACRRVRSRNESHLTP